MYRLLPIALMLAAFVAVLTYLPLKREVFYRLGIAQDLTRSCCSAERVEAANGNFDETSNLAIFNNQIIDYPKTSLAQLPSPAPDDSDSQVLGTMNAGGEEKWIEVSLDDQKLRAWEGNTVIMEFPISSGKWAPTPKGTYHIWYKTRYQKMEGGSRDLGTYYNLPNVPHNMFFYLGYAIHGAYWHNNFGQPMSHGCVNAPLNYVSQLFEWTGPVVTAGQNVARATTDNPGTKVFIH